MFDWFINLFAFNNPPKKRKVVARRKPTLKKKAARDTESLRQSKYKQEAKLMDFGKQDILGFPVGDIATNLINSQDINAQLYRLGSSINKYSDLVRLSNQGADVAAPETLQYYLVCAYIVRNKSKIEKSLKNKENPQASDVISTIKDMIKGGTPGFKSVSEELSNYARAVFEEVNAATKQEESTDTQVDYGDTEEGAQGKQYAAPANEDPAVQLSEEELKKEERTSRYNNIRSRIKRAFKNDSATRDTLLAFIDQAVKPIKQSTIPNLTKADLEQLPESARSVLNNYIVDDGKGSDIKLDFRTKAEDSIVDSKLSGASNLKISEASDALAALRNLYSIFIKTTKAGKEHTQKGEPKEYRRLYGELQSYKARIESLLEKYGEDSKEAQNIKNTTAYDSISSLLSKLDQESDTEEGKHSTIVFPEFAEETAGWMDSLKKKIDSLRQAIKRSKESVGADIYKQMQTSMDSDKQQVLRDIVQDPNLSDEQKHNLAVKVGGEFALAKQDLGTGYASYLPEGAGKAGLQESKQNEVFAQILENTSLNQFTETANAILNRKEDADAITNAKQQAREYITNNVRSGYKDEINRVIDEPNLLYTLSPAAQTDAVQALNQFIRSFVSGVAGGSTAKTRDVYKDLSEASGVILPKQPFNKQRALRSFNAGGLREVLDSKSTAEQLDTQYRNVQQKVDQVLNYQDALTKQKELKEQADTQTAAIEELKAKEEAGQLTEEESKALAKQNKELSDVLADLKQVNAIVERYADTLGKDPNQLDSYLKQLTKTKQDLQEDIKAEDATYFAKQRGREKAGEITDEDIVTVYPNQKAVQFDGTYFPVHTERLGEETYYSVDYKHPIELPVENPETTEIKGRTFVTGSNTDKVYLADSNSNELKDIDVTKQQLESVKQQLAEQPQQTEEQQELPKEEPEEDIVTPTKEEDAYAVQSGFVFGLHKTAAFFKFAEADDMYKDFDVDIERALNKEIESPAEDDLYNPDTAEKSKKEDTDLSKEFSMEKLGKVLNTIKMNSEEQWNDIVDLVRQSSAKSGDDLAEFLELWANNNWNGDAAVRAYNETAVEPRNRSYFWSMFKRNVWPQIQKNPAVVNATNELSTGDPVEKQDVETTEYTHV